jgi:hypothetical protein
VRTQPYVLHQHGMDRAEHRRLAQQTENLEIARQCEDAAEIVGKLYPIAARLLLQEAQLWRGV